MPESMSKNGTDYRYVTDHLGSVREVWDNRGNIVQDLKYDSFGEVIMDSNPGFQPFGFSGGHCDSKTGLARFGVRDFDGKTAIWLSRDSIKFEGDDTNLYSYVLDDPVNLIDKDGKAWWFAAARFGALICTGAAENTELNTMASMREIGREMAQLNDAINDLEEPDSHRSTCDNHGPGDSDALRNLRLR